MDVGELFVDHIGELVTAVGGGLGLVHHACVWLRDGRVAYAGRRDGLPADAVARHAVRLDAGGRLVTPGLVEPHAHPLFAGSRAHEFDLRNQGKSYLEIQAAGGGILATVAATTAASDEDLVADALGRLERFLSHGVTVVEAKSGYLLTVDGERRLLDLLAEVRRRARIDVSPTLLAHVPPPEARAGEARAAFVARFCAELIPAAAHGGLAEAVDVYCDEGAFTLAETRALLEAARAQGLGLRAHAEQFTHTGVGALAAELGARSVEHLEQLDDVGRRALAAAGTVCNLLPGAALTLRLPWPDARALVAAGCTVALGTDCNPGSSLSESQPLMMSLACTQMGLSASEAWLGVTRHAARAVGRADAGHLGAGARGDLVVWQADDHRAVPQHLGAALVDTVVVGGKVALAGSAAGGAAIHASGTHV